MEQIPQPPAPGSSPGVLAPSSSERQWAASAHWLALLLALLTSWIAGAAGVLGAGIVYAVKHDESEFVADHAREALNFNLSMLIYSLGAVAVAVALLGATVLTLGIGLILTLPAGILLVLAVATLAITWLVCSLMATVKALNGERYRYPFAIRLFR